MELYGENSMKIAFQKWNESFLGEPSELPKNEKVIRKLKRDENGSR